LARRWSLNQKKVVTIEKFVVVLPWVVALLLWTEGPDGARNQSSKVLCLCQIGALDCSAEVVSPPLVLLLLVDDTLLIIWVRQRVFVDMIVFMDVGLICVHLSEPLPWRLGSIGKEGAQIVVLLGSIGLRGYKIASPLPPIVSSTKLGQPLPDHSVGCAERELLIPAKEIPWNDQMLLLHHLACSDSLSVHSPAANKILNQNLHHRALSGEFSSLAFTVGLPARPPPSLPV
jgi:hypothetical protein